MFGGPFSNDVSSNCKAREQGLRRSVDGPRVFTEVVKIEVRLRKMLNPLIARLPVIAMEFINRPSEEADCIYETKVK